MTSQNVIMGFDYGTRKIGIAVGQLITKTANPIAIISARDGVPDWSEIEKLILEWQPAQLVVGLPLNMDETESEMSRRSLKFARRLTGRFNIPHHTIDERLTSREARSIHESHSSTQRGPAGRYRDEIDDIAAQIILESWLKLQ